MLPDPRALSAEVDAGSAQESAAKQGLSAVPDCNAIGNGAKIRISAPKATRVASPEFRPPQILASASTSSANSI